METKDEASGHHDLVTIINEVFSELGQRATFSRQLLADELIQLGLSGAGFTVEGLWHKLRNKNESIGRATVFRCIRELVDRAVLDCIDFSDGTRLFRVCGQRVAQHEHHHHLACNKCHAIEDVNICLSDSQLNQIAESYHFRMASHTLTIYGLCEQCATTA